MEEKIIEQAENIMCGNLNFVHPWDMERCEKYYKIPDKWNETPNGDPEWIYMRSRMGYFDGLILLYEKTKKIKYIDKINEILYDFIDSHKKLIPEESTRTLDSGIRIINILRLLHYYNDKNLKIDKKKIVEHLKDTIDYLFDHYISKYDLSNWGMIQMSAVYSLALYLSNNELKEKSFLLLKKQLDSQILDDGLHWEKSMTYHCQIVIYLIWIVYMSKKYDEKDNINYFKNKLFITSNATKKLHYPDMTQINFGDSDDPEIESIISLADYFLGIDSRYKITETSKLFIHDLYKYKCENKKIQNTENLKLSNNLKREVYSFNTSGYFHVREEDFSFSCYSTPMSSAHTNIDYLHFNYYKNGKIFVDSGRYTYTETELRMHFKSQEAHNSIIVDGIASSIPTHSWEYDNYPVVMPIATFDYGDYELVEMSYFEQERGYLATRKCVVIEDNVIIINLIRYKGKHEAHLRYHLYPNIKIEKINNLNNTFVKLDKNYEKIYKGITLNDNTHFISQKYEIEDSLYSSEYNKIEKSKKIFKKIGFTDELFDIDFVINKNVIVEELDVYQKGVIVDLNIARAFKIITKNSKYILFIKSNETIKGNKVFHVENTPFYGNVKCIKME